MNQMEFEKQLVEVWDLRKITSYIWMGWVWETSGRGLNFRKLTVTKEPGEFEKELVHDFKKLSTDLEEIQKSVLKTMQDEW